MGRITNRGYDVVIFEKGCQGNVHSSWSTYAEARDCLRELYLKGIQKANKWDYSKTWISVDNVYAEVNHGGRTECFMVVG